MQFRFRTYDVGLGRFVGRDPIGYEGGGLGLYGAYFVPDGVDPLGLEAIRFTYRVNSEYGSAQATVEARIWCENSTVKINAQGTRNDSDVTKNGGLFSRGQVSVGVAVTYDDYKCKRPNGQESTGQQVRFTAVSTFSSSTPAWVKNAGRVADIGLALGGIGGATAKVAKHGVEVLGGLNPSTKTYDTIYVVDYFVCCECCDSYGEAGIEKYWDTGWEQKVVRFSRLTQPEIDRRFETWHTADKTACPLAEAVDLGPPSKPKFIPLNSPK